MSTHMALIAQMPGHDGGHFMGTHWLWWSVWILVFALLIWGLVRLLGDRTAAPRDGVERDEMAEEALRRRFAEGEIDEEEYNRRLSVLRETPGSRPKPGE